VDREGSRRESSSATEAEGGVYMEREREGGRERERKERFSQHRSESEPGVEREPPVR